MNVCCREPCGEQSFPAGPGPSTEQQRVPSSSSGSLRGSWKGPHHTCGKAASGLWVPRATGSPWAGVKAVAVRTPCGGRGPAAQEACRAWCPRVALSMRPPQAPWPAFKPVLVCFLLNQQLEAVCMFVLLVHHSRHSWPASLPAPRGGPAGAASSGERLSLQQLRSGIPRPGLYGERGRDWTVLALPPASLDLGEPGTSEPLPAPQH